MNGNDFYFCKDIEKILGVKTSKAYQIISQLNEELEGKGLLTFREESLLPTSEKESDWIKSMSPFKGYPLFSL